MASPASLECKNCISSSMKILELTDEHNVTEAQRDHYRDWCEELNNELAESRRQLNGKSKISDYNPEPSFFDSESLERLREWQKCLAYCIEEKEEQMEAEKLKGEEAPAGGKASKEGQKKQQRSNPGGRPQTVLPFSPLGLSGFLTQNHKLTQKYTEYPNPRPKKS